MRITVWFLVLAVQLASCVSKQTIPAYFKGNTDSAAMNQLKYVEPLIQQNDVLYIGVHSPEAKPEDVLVYNQPNYFLGSAPGVVSQSQTLGYMIGADGMITFPQVGKVKAIGLTKMQLAAEIENRLTKYLKQPSVTVRFLNYRVTVLGEVAKAGTFSIPNEKVTIVEALGMAGDITMYGKKNNVLVIREVNGVKQFGQIDLTKAAVFGSPYFYLQQNDVVIVESDNYKIQNLDNTATRNVSLGLSIASAVGSLGFLIVSFLQLNK
jgi:polysaccharide biosynthesis/export protein